MSKIDELIYKLADQKAKKPTDSGIRMTIALSAKNHEALSRLANALDLPSGVLAARLLAAALWDAEERAADLDLFED